MKGSVNQVPGHCSPQVGSIVSLRVHGSTKKHMETYILSYFTDTDACTDQWYELINCIKNNNNNYNSNFLS